MQAFKIIGGIFLALAVVMVLIAASTSPEKAAKYEHARQVEAECDKMMSDAALGNERRMTRAICDQMKAKNK